MTDDLVTRARQYEGQSFETTACYNGLRDELAARVEADAATIARLEGERDFLRKANTDLFDVKFVAEKAAKAAEAKVAALVEEMDALKAFIDRHSYAELADEAAARIQAETRAERLEAALRELIDHTHNCEKELTEDLHRADFCGESLPLTNARATLAEMGDATDD